MISVLLRRDRSRRYKNDSKLAGMSLAQVFGRRLISGPAQGHQAKQTALFVIQIPPSRLDRAEGVLSGWPIYRLAECFRGFRLIEPILFGPR